MSIGTYFRLDFHITYLPSTPNIETKFFEKRKVFENSPAYFAFLLKFAGVFSKSCFFLKDFKEFYGVDKEYVVCGAIFFGTSYEYV